MDSSATRWSWSSPSGQREAALLADGVVEFRTLGTAEPTVRLAWRDAFQRGRELVDDHDIRFALVAALAPRLDVAAGDDPALAARLAFWRAYDATKVKSESLIFVRPAAGGRADAVVLQFGPHGLVEPGPGAGPPRLVLPDELFAHGPATVGVPAQHRATIRRALWNALRPGHALNDSHAVPRLNPAQIPRQSWSWAATSSGHTWLELEANVVRCGYQYGHDQGSDSYPPERVLSRAPGVRLDAPDDVEQAVRALLKAAGDPPGSNPPVEPSVEPAAVVVLRERAVDRAPWNVHRLVTAPVSPTQARRLGARIAWGLYASLRPEQSLPTKRVEADRRVHGRSYNWENDGAWIGADGTGILVAEHCVGALPGDGVEEVYHVLPGGGRRVIFDVPLDFGRNDIAFQLSADDDATASALVDHVVRWLMADGFAPTPTDVRALELRRAP